jgi:hypothetical protein
MVVLLDSLKETYRSLISQGDEGSKMLKFSGILVQLTTFWNFIRMIFSIIKSTGNKAPGHYYMSKKHFHPSTRSNLLDDPDSSLIR